jgi:2,4-dienoyl-CoA reductase (NADPH2)
VGEEFPILFRFSASDFVPGSIDLNLTSPFAQALEKAGVDCLDVSAGTSDSEPNTIHPDQNKTQGCFAPLAAKIRQVVNIPVIAVGKIATRETAESILRQGQADLIALGRPLIADPDWPRKVLEGRESEIIPCVWENLGCLQNSIHKGKPIRCVQNPAVGFEHEQIDS